MLDERYRRHFRSDFYTLVMGLAARVAGGGMGHAEIDHSAWAVPAPARAPPPAH